MCIRTTSIQQVCDCYGDSEQDADERFLSVCGGFEGNDLEHCGHTFRRNIVKQLQ